MEYLNQWPEEAEITGKAIHVHEVHQVRTLDSNQVFILSLLDDLEQAIFLSWPDSESMQ